MTIPRPWLRILGALVGAVLGVLIAALGRMLVGFPLTVIPVESFLWQIVPGGVMGILVGAIWPTPVAKAFASFGISFGDS
jgi:hypothetical protein